MIERVALTGLLLAAGFALADFAPSDWQYTKTMKVEARPANALRLEKDVYVICQTDLADIRVMRGTEEIPYVIVTRSPKIREKSVAATMQDRSVSAAGVEAVMAFPPGVGEHNRITITASATNFRHKVKLFASENGKEYAQIKKDAYIFDFDADGHRASQLTIDYPTSTRRYLKVVVEGAKDPGVLAGATMQLREEIEAAWQTIEKFDTPAPQENAQEKATMYVLDLSTSGLPRDRALLTIGDPAFHRSARWESSEDGKTWSNVAFSTVYRTEGSESLEVPVGGARTRYLRLTLFHGDNQPLKLRGVELQAVSRNVVFPSTVAGEYKLYFGNPSARFPSYDLAMVLPESALEAAVAVTAEGREANAAYRAPVPPPKPLSERNPWLLYGVLGVAVVGLGILALRMMKNIQKDGSKS